MEINIIANEISRAEGDTKLYLKEKNSEKCTKQRKQRWKMLSVLHLSSTPQTPELLHESACNGDSPLLWLPGMWVQQVILLFSQVSNTILTEWSGISEKNMSVSERQLSGNINCLPTTENVVFHTFFFFFCALFPFI